MESFNFLNELYKNLPNKDNLLASLDSISNFHSSPISAIPFGCEINIDQLFSMRRRAYREVILEKENDGVKLFQLHRFSKKNRSSEITGRFLVLQHAEFSKIYIAFTLEDGEFFHKELRPLLKSYYPFVLFTFIKSKNLKNLIDRFKLENALAEIKITRASHLLRFDNERSMSAVTWPKVSLDEAFQWVNENNGWFKSLQFDAKRFNYTVANIFIDRRGNVRTTGNFEMIYNFFILPTCKFLDNNYRQFSNRDRRSNDNLDAKPLVIEYENNLFEKIEENKNFIQAINKLDNASISVLHGNPYIHLSIIDYFDGSTFDLWVLNDKEIIIVPQMKGTVASIKRLINHIFDSFAEGEIKEYELT